MIKTALLTGLIAGTLTYNVTEAFDVTKMSVFRVVNVYETAAKLNPFMQTSEELRIAQNNLYSSADQIRGTAQIAYDWNNVTINDGQAIFRQASYNDHAQR
jgi:hypothetical protein